MSKVNPSDSLQSRSMKSRMCFQTRERTTFFTILGSFLLGVILIVITGSPIPALLVTPVIFYLPLRYVYIRFFEPFLSVTIAVPTPCGSNSKCRGLCGTWSSTQFVYSIVLFGLFFFMLSGGFTADSSSGEKVSMYSTISYNFLGSFLLLLLAMIFIDFFDVCYHIYLVGMGGKDGDDADTALKNNSSSSSKPSTILSQLYVMKRTAKEKKVKAGIMLLAYIALSTYSLVDSYQDPKPIELEVFLTRLPECMDGYKVALISDVHAGPLVSLSDTERVVEIVNAYNPNAVLMGGDFADGTPEFVSEKVVPFANFNAPDGAYYVLGNHEYLHGSNGVEWLTHMATLGVNTMDNTRVTLPTVTSGAYGTCSEAGLIDLLGVGEYSKEGAADVEKAVEGRDADKVALLLTHQPSVSTEAAKHSIDLQMSGHVHGGHTWPMHFGSWVANTHFAGLEKEPNSKMQVYVSLGAYGWGPRTRLGSENNVDIITLRSDPNDKHLNDDIPLNFASQWAILSFPFLALLFLFCCAFNASECKKGLCLGIKNEKDEDEIV